MKNTKNKYAKIRSIFAAKIRGICTVAIIALIAFSMAACPADLGGQSGENIETGETGGGSNTGEGGLKTGVVGKSSTGTDVIVMDTDMLNSNLKSISEDGTLTFDNLEADYMPVEGDIICAGISEPAPYGFLYKVISVSTDDGITVITTEWATLEDAVEEADVYESFDLEYEPDEDDNDDEITVELLPVELPPVDPNPMWRSAMSRAATPEEEWPSFSKTLKIEIKSKTVNGITVKGTIEIGTKFDCYMNAKTFKIRTFRLSATPSLKADISTTVGFKKEIKKGEGIKIPLKTIKFKSIDFMAGPVPVVIKPEIPIEIVITGEGAVEISAKLATWDYSYVSGIEWNKGEGWSAFNKNTSQPARYMDEYQVGLSGEFKAELRATVEFGVYGTFWVGVYGGGYGKLAGEISQTNNLNGKLTLSLGMEIGAKAELKILGIEIAEYEVKIFDHEWPIWERNGATVYNATTWNSTVNGIKNGGNNKTYTIFITGNFSMPGVTANTFGTVTGLNVTITGNKTITLTGQGSLLQIGANQAAVIHDTDFVGNSGNNIALLRLTDTNAKLTIEGNSSVSGNTGGSSGGGVYVGALGGATFTMKDSASISGNNASSGGGVYVSNAGATFTMTGGTISGNTGSSGGGGVMMNSGTFNMSGTALITGNTVTKGAGGGVGVSGATFTMTGGTISGNTANFTNIAFSGSGGGGVYLSYNSVFNMSGGTISGNTLNSGNDFLLGGGGVYVSSNSVFNMSGGTISSGNKASYYGGGVYVYGTSTNSSGSGTGTFNMTGGTISGNTSVNGGGVGVYGSVATFRMAAGTIYGSNADTSLKNTATDGAALYIGNNGTAQRGTFSVPADTTSAWTSKANLSTTDYTIKVVDGDVRP